MTIQAQLLIPIIEWLCFSFIDWHSELSSALSAGATLRCATFF